jgi:cellobiose epimerase
MNTKTKLPQAFLLGFTISMTLSCVKPQQTDKHLDEKTAIAKSIEKSLQTETLDKWYPLCFDQENGGFISTYSYDFKPEGDQEKMIVTQARHTWVNSKSFVRYPEQKKFAEGAALGFRFLKEKLWDHTYGGFYWLVTREGKVIDTVKTAYGNAFGIYALAAYSQAFKDTSALNLAKKAFLWLEANSHDPKSKGYFQHLRRNGQPIPRTEKTDPRAETGYKDQNSSIHLLEAFTELYEVWPHPLVRTRLNEMLLLIRDTMITDKGYLMLFFTPDWRPVSFRDSSRATIEKFHGLDHVSFGHDIETAYLMLEASHILGNEHDSVTLRVAKKMVDHCLRNGWDEKVGGFYDEGYYFKGEDSLTVLRDSKNWWAQAEGMNTLLLMSDLFPEDSNNYYEKFTRQWKYIDTNLIDHQYGDWYPGGIDKEPFQKTARKGGIWKATYHHYRSMVNCIDRLRKLL